MRRKRLLMASSNYWSSPLQVGSHQLARSFVQAGWDVGFVSDPISPWHFLGPNRKDLQARYDIYTGGGRTDCEGALWTYVPGSLCTPNNKPLLRSEWVGKHWSRLCWPRLLDVLARNGFGEVDLLYCDSVVHLGWLAQVPRQKSLYRVTDRISGFAKTTPAVLRLEQDLAREVDLVVYAARSLEGYVKALAPKRMAYLPNGVNYAHFASSDVRPPPEYAHIPRPIALYVGAMDVWFDYALMDEAARRLPTVSFVYVGPDELARQRLRPRPNVYLLGRRAYAEVPAYTSHADVGLIPFDLARHEELVRSIHPLKLYEYCASGLPVVAVEWEELASLKSPARLCRGPEAFIAALEQVIADPPNKALVQTFASCHDWQQRVTTLLSELGLGLPIAAQGGSAPMRPA